MTPFPVYMHGRHLTFGKPCARKQDKVLAFLIVSAKNMEVPIELSEDYCCDLSVPIPNGYSIGYIFSQLVRGNGLFTLS